MDNHSKNVCLIGALYILGCIFFAMEPLTQAIDMINSLNEEEPIFGGQEVYLICVAGIYLLLATLAGIMIYGVFKKSHLFVAPFTIISFVCLTLMLLNLLTEASDRPFYFIEDCIYKIGAQILIIYPIYTLFTKLRAQSLKEKSLDVGNSVNEKKTGLMAC